MIWLTVIQVLVFASWIGFIIYSFFGARRKIKTLADNIGLMVPFKCKKCHSIHEYSFDEYRKIVRKVRNETTVRKLNSIVRTKEYKYPCQTCGSKQWQKLLNNQPFSGTGYEKEALKIVILLIIKIFGYSIFVFLCIAITDSLTR